MFGWTNGWMNVEMYLAPKDMGKVQGLCGKADGDKNNDLQHRNSNTTSRLWTGIHGDFILSWK